MKYFQCVCCDSHVPSTTPFITCGLCRQPVCSQCSIGCAASCTVICSSHVRFAIPDQNFPRCASCQARDLDGDEGHRQGAEHSGHCTVAAVLVSVMRCPLCWHEPGCRQLGWCRGCWTTAVQSCSYWYCRECSDIFQCCEVCGERLQHPAVYFPLSC